MNSDAVLLASRLVIKSLKVALNCNPPFSQAFSYISFISFSSTSETSLFDISNG